MRMKKQLQLQDTKQNTKTITNDKQSVNFFNRRSFVTRCVY